MSYNGQVLVGYKEGALQFSLPYNTAQDFDFGSSVVLNPTTQVLDLANSLTDILVFFSLDSTTITGSDVVASGKLPIIRSNALVASALFDDGAGAAYVPVVGDIGDYVVASPTTAGKWEIKTAAGLTDADVYVGNIFWIETFNEVEMAVFDFNPRHYNK
jgi:hypothetical protein